MTLDILHFIQQKGGNPDEIRESQRKRGLSEEIVDEIVQMYADWVKRTQRSEFAANRSLSSTPPQSTMKLQTWQSQ